SRIAEALDVIAADDARPRTKREIERITDLGHDTVARAFRQDAEEENTYRITEKFTALAQQLGSNRRSPAREKELAHEQELADLRREASDLNKQLDRYAMSLYAYYLAAQPQPDGASATDPIPIGRNRKRQR
ncbi:hypothetical protein ACL02O_23560, partial [Micromonospora sp. MS34]|uniref:hypothetical protein n=1 Tax=Micromonospora sp. MS34 TaxID=3385971 RepID=UPI00399FF410